MRRQAEQPEIIAIMQPYIFPYIGYFQLIYASDVFVLYNDVSWINRGWINRNRILLNGNPHTFTIPCKKVSQNKLINETELDLNDISKKKLLTTIKSAYQKAPFFEEVFEKLELIISSNLPGATVDIFAEKTIRWVFQYLSIDVAIMTSADSFSETRDLKKADRLIAISKMLNCQSYINAIGGKELYTKSSFKEEGLELLFLDSKVNDYPQFNNSFVSNLSIIDVLMFNSRDNILNMLGQYELV